MHTQHSKTPLPDILYFRLCLQTHFRSMLFSRKHTSSQRHNPPLILTSAISFISRTTVNFHKKNYSPILSIFLLLSKCRASDIEVLLWTYNLITSLKNLDKSYRYAVPGIHSSINTVAEHILVPSLKHRTCHLIQKLRGECGLAKIWSWVLVERTRQFAVALLFDKSPAYPSCQCYTIKHYWSYLESSHHNNHARRNGQVIYHSLVV